MNMKQLLIPVVLTAIFSLNANASLVELEFSNGATLSFDDTVNSSYIFGVATDHERTIREYETDSVIISHPDNVMTSAVDSGIYTREAHGVRTFDLISAYTAIYSAGLVIKTNRIWTNQSFDLIGSNISSSLADMIGLNNMFRFKGFGKQTSVKPEFNAYELITLTSVKLDGVSQTSPVPAPPAVWLMGTAIMGLIARRKLWNKK